jgi:hypothetical protein
MLDVGAIAFVCFLGLLKQHSEPGHSIRFSGCCSAIAFFLFLRAFETAPRL